MRLLEIQDQLRQFLPLHTDRFNDWIDASYSLVGNTATVTTSEAHGLVVDDYVNITDVVFLNPLVNLKSVNGTASCSSTVQHDLSQGFQQTIEISGVNEAVFNGEFSNDINIFNRNQFTYSVTPFDTTTATGSPVLHEKNLMRYNGLFKVVSTPTTTTYTVEVIGEGDFVSDCRSANDNSRIAVAFNDEQALNYYTSQKSGDYWAFIIPEATQVSKQREGNNDFNLVHKDGEYNQLTQRSFNILVLAPANEDSTPALVMDECYVDLANALRKSLMTYTPIQVNSQKTTGIAYDGDVNLHYDNSIYGHLYSFNCSVTLKNKDGFEPPSAAVRKIIIDYKDNNTNNKLTIATDTIEFKEN